MPKRRNAAEAEARIRYLIPAQRIGTVVDQRHIIEVDDGRAVAKLMH